MTIEEAIQVLNRRKYVYPVFTTDYVEWVFKPRYDEGFWVYTRGMADFDSLTEFAAIAIAEKLERDNGNGAT